MRSDVPQGSVLGPLLFILYINDIDDGIVSRLSKFADDTKLFSEVSTKSNVIKLQSDIDKLAQWVNTWQLKFNEDKCKVLHFGSNNPKEKYQLNNIDLESSRFEKDLGVLISDDLKPSSHIDGVILKANRILGMMYRSIQTRTKDVMLPLYTALVRPHLEYCVQAWCPHYIKDIQKLEKVQRRAIRMITDLRGHTYEQKLKELKLFSLGKRRIRGDIISTFRLLKGIDKLDSHVLFTPSLNIRTRGHYLKLEKTKVKTDTRKYFFSNRIVDLWNSLPIEAISCKTVSSFKHHLDKFLANQGIH